MTARQRSIIGKTFVIVGALWFVLDFFWFPPLLVVLFLIHVPEHLLDHVWPAEFILSATLVTAGTLLWRSATKRISIVAFLIVASCLAILVVGTFRIWGWIR